MGKLTAKVVTQISQTAGRYGDGNGLYLSGNAKRHEVLDSTCPGWRQAH